MMDNWNIDNENKSNSVISFDHGKTWYVIINDELQTDNYKSKLEATLFLKSVTE